MASHQQALLMIGSSGPFDYPAFLSGYSGEGWLADTPSYKEAARTNLAVVGDNIGSWTGISGTAHANVDSTPDYPSLEETSGGKKYMQFVLSGSSDKLVADTTAAYWNFLHDGAATTGYICMAVRCGNTSNPNHIYYLCGTGNANSNSRGVSTLFVDDISENNRAYFTSSNGSTYALNLSSADDAISPNTDAIFEVIKNGTDVKIYINSVEKANGTLGTTSTLNCAHPLSIGQSNVAMSGSLSPLQGRFYGLLVTNRIPDTSQRTLILNDMASRCENPPI